MLIDKKCSARKTCLEEEGWYLRRLDQEILKANSLLQISDVQLDYIDTRWHDFPSHVLGDLLEVQLKELVVYIKKHVPFYKEHYRKFDERTIRSLTFEELFLALPALTRDHLTFADPQAFLPEGFTTALPRELQNIRGEYKTFHTGGSTSGMSIGITYSPEDWRAATKHIARHFILTMKSNIEFLNGANIVGVYDSDHITNWLYGSGLSLLGSHFHRRPGVKHTLGKMYDSIQFVEPIGLLAPPSSHKGYPLEMLMEYDAEQNGAKWRLDTRVNPGFKLVMWSSNSISPELYQETVKRNIPYRLSQFGSTEVAPEAGNHPDYPTKFQIGYGPSMLLGITADGKDIAGPGDVGMLYSTRCGATLPGGKNVLPTGTIIVKYAKGDQALFESHRIFGNVERIAHTEAKRDFGCEV